MALPVSKQAIVWGCDYLKIPLNGLKIKAMNSKLYWGLYYHDKALIEISIHSDNPIKTLFHELVHYRQFRSGEFKFIGVSKSIYYQNKTGKRYQVRTRKDYLKAPHEIQARNISTRMYNKWLNVKSI